MEVAFDLTNSMDFHLIRPRAVSAKVGVKVGSLTLPWRAEGAHITGGWLMHVEDGILFEGEEAGGWPTPWAVAKDLHICYLNHGVRGTCVSGVHLTDLNLYASHVSTYPTAVYFAGGCRNLIMTGLEMWMNRAGYMAGYVLDATTDVAISGGIISGGTPVGAVLTPSTSGILMDGVRHNSPLYNMGKGNIFT